MKKRNINCKLEVIRGEHGNPLLLVKFYETSNFRIDKKNDEYVWVPTLDESRLISDTLYLLNSMVDYLKYHHKNKYNTDFDIGHD